LVKFELIIYDDESDPEIASSLYEKLITQDKVDFLLGPYSSAITMSATAIVEQHGKIMIEANGASSKIFERGFQRLFGILSAADLYTKAGLELLAEKGAKTIVLLVEGDVFSRSAADWARKWASQLGLEILAEETFPKGSSTVASAITRFKGLDPDVFVGIGHYDDAILFVTESKELGLSPRAFLLTVGPATATFVTDVGRDADFMIGGLQWHQDLNWQSSEKIGFASPMDFFDRYRAKYGRIPDYHVAESAAAPLALALAMMNADSVEPDMVLAALRELDVVTFYGPIGFDETGKNRKKPMVVIQIQSGVRKLIGPEDVATDAILYPFPGWER
jgi:branched-chain amino acid transport system substrate-binding protein